MVPFATRVLLAIAGLAIVVACGGGDPSGRDGATTATDSSVAPPADEPTTTGQATSVPPTTSASSATTVPATAPNSPPTAALEVCGPDACAGASATLAVTLAEPGGPDLAFTASGSTDPDGDSITFEWLLNGEQVSLLESFRFDAAALGVGAHEVQLVVSDGRGGQTASGARIDVTGVVKTVELCREALEFERTYGDRSFVADLTRDGVDDTVTVDFDDSPYDTPDEYVWGGRVMVTSGTGDTLHQVSGIGVDILGFPSPPESPPYALGDIVDATGDGREDVVLCLVGDFRGHFETDVLVLSDHTGSWTTVLDEDGINTVVDVTAPAVDLVSLSPGLLSDCIERTTRSYVFAGDHFEFAEEVSIPDESSLECAPVDGAADNPFGMLVGWTELAAGPGEHITLDSFASDVEFAAATLISDPCGAECNLHVWYLDDVEVGRGDFVFLPFALVPLEGNHEIKLVVIEPEGDGWEGVVSVNRILHD